VPNGKGKGGKGGAKGGQVVIITPDDEKLPKSSDSMNSSSGSPQGQSQTLAVKPLSPSSAYSVNSNHPTSPKVQTPIKPQKSPMMISSLLVSIPLSKIDVSRLARFKKLRPGYFDDPLENGRVNGIETAAIKKEYNPIFDDPPPMTKLATPAKLKFQSYQQQPSPKEEKFSPERPRKRSNSNSSSSNHKEKKRKRLASNVGETMQPTNHDRSVCLTASLGQQEEATASRQEFAFQKPIYISYFERHPADMDDLEIR
jgi:hypothetical protein